MYITVNCVIAGLYHSVTDEDPDLDHIEKLLKGWCRSKVYRNGHEIKLTSVCLPKVRRLIEKYERTNEFAIAVLAGKLHLMDNGMKEMNELPDKKIQTPSRDKHPCLEVEYF